jgi:hypothetical protein
MIPLHYLQNDMNTFLLVQNVLERLDSIHRSHILSSKTAGGAASWTTILLHTTSGAHVQSLPIALVPVATTAIRTEHVQTVRRGRLRSRISRLNTVLLQRHLLASLPPPTNKPELLEAVDPRKHLNDMVVNSVILKRSADAPLLGVWDLTNWRTLEFTMHDLLVVKG